jgi:hypothetical protein
MQGERLSQLALQYQPMRKRLTGRPKKRWKDQFLEGVEEYRINKPSEQFKKKMKKK